VNSIFGVELTGLPDVHALLRLRLVRFFHAALAIGALTVALVAWWLPGLGDPAVRQFIVAAHLTLAVVAGGALWLLPRGVEAGVAVATLLAITSAAASSLLLGWGLANPGLAFNALYVALICAVLGVLPGAVVAAGAAASVLALAWAETQGLLGHPIGPTAALVTLHLLVLAAGFGGGWVVSAMMWRNARTAHDRGQRFEGLLAIAADAYWELGPDLRLTALTRERSGGRSIGPDRGLGRLPWELPGLRVDPDTLDRLQADLESRQPFRDLPLAWQDESGLRHFLVSGEPRSDARGQFSGYWGVARDITVDWNARRALAATESRYHDLFERIPTPLVLHQHGRVVDANPSALLMFGFRDLAAMIGAELLPMYEDGESRETARQRMMHLRDMAPGDALPVTEYRIRARNGRPVIARATTVTVEAENGPAMLSIYVDDTERRAAEDAVRRSEAMLSHLVSSSPDAITLTELASGRYAMVNEAFEQLTGYRADEVLGRTSVELGMWGDAAQRADFLAQLRQHGAMHNLPCPFVTKAGVRLQMLASGGVFMMDGREYLVINARDITANEQERLEHQAILESASIGIAMTRDRTFQMANPAFEAMFGWPRGELVGQPGAVVWPDAQAYAEVGRVMGPLLARGEPVEVEAVARRRDGSTFDCRVLGRAVDPARPTAGATIWILEDITERKRIDLALARARDEAEAANRAKSAFLANTSHELRTPLNQLLGMTQLARGAGNDEARRDQYLDQIVDSAKTLAAIVSDILDLSRIEAGKLDVEQAPFDLDALLESVRRTHAPQAMARSLTLALHLDHGFGLVLGDAQRVRQILGNFLGNALKFTRTGGIEIHAMRLDGERVRLEVRDTGPGIAPEIQARLFQPFTQADDSTTRRFGGTGLGLSICHELAQLMGGRVGLHSTPGEGSCFWVELPLPTAEHDATISAFGADDFSVRGAHVLMVDDNEINMMVAVAQLEQFGARVGQAIDGQQAIDAVAAADAAGDPYDLVMMDLQMPGKSGYEVARELRLRYDAQVLPIVAYTAAVLVTERDAALAAGMNDFLPKPTETDRLRQMVARWARLRRALDDPPGPG